MNEHIYWYFVGNLQDDEMWTFRILGARDFQLFMLTNEDSEETFLPFYCSCLDEWRKKKGSQETWIVNKLITKNICKDHLSIALHFRISYLPPKLCCVWMAVQQISTTSQVLLIVFRWPQHLFSWLCLHIIWTHSSIFKQMSRCSHMPVDAVLAGEQQEPIYSWRLSRKQTQLFRRQEDMESLLL